MTTYKQCLKQHKNIKSFFNQLRYWDALWFCNKMYHLCWSRHLEEGAYLQSCVGNRKVKWAFAKIIEAILCVERLNTACRTQALTVDKRKYRWWIRLKDFRICSRIIVLPLLPIKWVDTATQ